MLFGTSGIRGLYGSQITESLANKIASIFSDKDLSIGRDTRESGLSLADTASRSIQKKGKNVYELGIVPTPTVALATLIHKSNGIMVTASVDYYEPTLVKDLENGYIKMIKVGEFIDSHSNGGFEKYAVLAFNPKTGKVEFKKIKNVFRHKLSEPLYKITLSYGKTVRVTASHSVFCYLDGRITCLPTKDLKLGDYVPVSNSIPEENKCIKLNLIKELWPHRKYLRKIIIKGNDVIALNRSKKFEQAKKRVKISDSGKLFLLNKRNELSLSRVHLAKICGISPMSIQRMEIRTDREYVKLDYLNNYLFFHKIDPGSFINFIEQEKIFDQNFIDGRTYNFSILSELEKNDLNSLKECTLHGSQYPQNAVNNEIEITPELVRLIGYYLAEGNLELEDRVAFTIGLPSRGHEKIILNDIVNCSKKTFNFHPKIYHQPKNSVKIAIDNIVIYEIFSKIFRFQNKKSFNKCFPDFIFNFSYEYKLELLRALFLGDGSLIKNKGIKFNTTSRDMASNIAYLLTQFGINYCYSTYNDKRKNRKPMHILSITNKKDLKKLHYVWNDHWQAKFLNTTYLIDKKIEIKKFNQLDLLKIKKIEKVESSGEYVYDFSVEGETFVAGVGGICCHNSHNPDEYNGLKLIENGHEISKEREKQIEFDYENNIHPKDSPELGSLFHDHSILEQHKELIISNIDQSIIRKKKPKIVIDCNGAGSVITPSLLADLGCDVISINAEAGPFNRPSEPNEKNLSVLRALVPKLNADLGLAHDGDGDRTVAVDEKGNMVPFDIQLALMIQYEMKKSKNKKIISTMESSLTIRETVERNGGSIIITPVGSTYVASKMEAENAIFGGEPCGEYIYKGGVQVPDGPMAAVKLVEMYCMNGLLSNQAKTFKTHFMARERFKCTDKYKAIDSIKEDIKIEGSRSEEDGIRIDEEDGWFLIRASGTEPIIRLTMEYIDKKKLDKRKEELSKLINEKIKSFS